MQNYRVSRIVRHEGESLEEVAYVCYKCRRTVAEVVPVFKNAVVEYEDGTKNFWTKFFVSESEGFCVNCRAKGCKP